MNVDNWDDEDWDDDSPGEDEGESMTVPCSSCQADVYEEAEQCPYCGEYIIRLGGVWAGRPNWWVTLGGIGIVATIFAVLVSLR